MSESKDHTVEFLSPALQDMTEIVSSYIMLGSRKGAVRIKDGISRAAAQLRRFPYSGIAVPDEKLVRSGFRMFVIEKYLMFYKVFDDEKKVIVYRVLDGTRDYPAIMNRIHNIGNE